MMQKVAENVRFLRCEFCFDSLQFDTFRDFRHNDIFTKFQILSLSFILAISKFNQLEIEYEGMFKVILAAICSIFWPEFCSQTDTHTHRQTDDTKNNTSTKTSFCGGGGN